MSDIAKYIENIQAALEAHQRTLTALTNLLEAQLDTNDDLARRLTALEEFRRAAP